MSAGAEGHLAVLHFLYIEFESLLGVISLVAAEKGVGAIFRKTRRPPP